MLRLLKSKPGHLSFTIDQPMKHPLVISPTNSLLPAPIAQTNRLPRLNLMNHSFDNLAKVIAPINLNNPPYPFTAYPLNLYPPKAMHSMPYIWLTVSIKAF
jgi:hypothetical protein